MPGPLSRATLPVTSVPIRLPTTTLPRASPPIMRLAPLPEMRFRAASVVPPIMQKLDPAPRTPTPLPTATVPVTSVPMKLPSMIMFPCIDSAIPASERLITSPLITENGTTVTNPASAVAPLNSITGFPEKPGWVVPSMVTRSVISGKADAGAIVWTPEPILNRISSAPALALACMIAARSVQSPVPSSQISSLVSLSGPSPVELTVNMCAGAVTATVAPPVPLSRITRSVSASAFKRIGSTATGSLSRFKDTGTLEGAGAAKIVASSCSRATVSPAGMSSCRWIRSTRIRSSAGRPETHARAKEGGRVRSLCDRRKSSLGCQSSILDCFCPAVETPEKDPD